MTDNMEWERLPEIINGVIDLLPNGDLWRARFAQEPGLAMRREDNGRLTVLHHGDTVFQFDPEVLEADAETGTAWAMVDGQEQEIGLVQVPKDEL